MAAWMGKGWGLAEEIGRGMRMRMRNDVGQKWNIRLLEGYTTSHLILT